MSYNIEVLWECSVCHKRGNRGLKDRYCGNCGHKKEAADSEYMPDDISERAALGGDEDKKASAGADWVCMYCDSLQNQLNSCCSNCGALERGTKKAVVGEVTADTRATQQRTTSEAPTARSIPAQRPRPSRRLAYVASAVSAALTVALALWYLFTPYVVSTHVSALAWKHEVVIDRYKIHVHEGWYPDGGAFNVSPLGMRTHHYNRVAVGSHSEPYLDRYACGQDCTTTPSYTTCSSNGNGTARCTKHGGNRSCSTRYCTRTAYRSVTDYANIPVNQMWYGWSVWEWGYDRTVTKQGSTRETIWPTAEELKPPDLGTGEQERSVRVGHYEVTFRDREGRTYKTSPNSYWEFLRYEQDEPFKLKVTRAGTVEVLP